MAVKVSVDLFGSLRHSQHLTLITTADATTSTAEVTTQTVGITAAVTVNTTGSVQGGSLLNGTGSPGGVQVNETRGEAAQESTNANGTSGIPGMDNTTAVNFTTGMTVANNITGLVSYNNTQGVNSAGGVYKANNIFSLNPTVVPPKDSGSSLPTAGAVSGSYNGMDKYHPAGEPVQQPPADTVTASLSGMLAGLAHQDLASDTTTDKALLSSGATGTATTMEASPSQTEATQAKQPLSSSSYMSQSEYSLLRRL